MNRIIFVSRPDKIITKPLNRNDNVIKKPVKQIANNQSKQNSTMTDYFKMQKHPNASAPSKYHSHKNGFDGEKRIEKNGDAIDNQATTSTISKQDSVALYDFGDCATSTQASQRTANFIEKPILKPIPSQNTLLTQIRAKIQAQQAVTNNGFVTAQSIFKPKINSDQTNGNQPNGKQNGQPKKLNRFCGDILYDINNLFEDINENDKVNKNTEGTSKSIVNVNFDSSTQENDTVSDMLGIKCKSLADHVIQNDFDEESNEFDSLTCDENAFLAVEEYTQLCDEQVIEKSRKKTQFPIEPTNGNDRLSVDTIETNTDKRSNNNQMSDDIETQIKMMKPLKQSIGKSFLNSYAYNAPPRMQHSSQPVESPQLERKKPRPTINEMIMKGERGFDDGTSAIRTMPKPRQKYTS